MDDDQHLKRTIICQICGFIGLNGDLVASASSPRLCCPKCGWHEIKYLVHDAPARDS